MKKYQYNEYQYPIFLIVFLNLLTKLFMIFILKNWLVIYSILYLYF